MQFILRCVRFSVCVYLFLTRFICTVNCTRNLACWESTGTTTRKHVYRPPILADLVRRCLSDVYRKYIFIFILPHPDIYLHVHQAKQKLINYKILILYYALDVFENIYYGAGRHFPDVTSESTVFRIWTNFTRINKKFTILVCLKTSAISGKCVIFRCSRITNPTIKEIEAYEEK